MAAYQYVYHMQGVSKTYAGGKKCFENINLNFLPGVKIGVVGVNGAGKSTLMKIMAGLDTDFTGEAWHAEGAKVGYLPQEPKLDESLSVRENVMLGVKAKKDIPLRMPSTIKHLKQLNIASKYKDRIPESEKPDTDTYICGHETLDSTIFVSS